MSTLSMPYPDSYIYIIFPPFLSLFVPLFFPLHLLRLLPRLLLFFISSSLPSTIITQVSAYLPPEPKRQVRRSKTSINISFFRSLWSAKRSAMGLLGAELGTTFFCTREGVESKWYRVSDDHDYTDISLSAHIFIITHIILRTDLCGEERGVIVVERNRIAVYKGLEALCCCQLTVSVERDQVMKFRGCILLLSFMNL